jgi:hypothetical protein
MKNTLLRTVVCALLVCAVVGPSFGRASKKKPIPPPEQPMISAVAGNTITVIDNKTAKTLTVTQFTEITVNGQKATMAELKPGMVVSIVLGSSPTQASRITATTKK